jgi:hypothetical protein
MKKTILIIILLIITSGSTLCQDNSVIKKYHIDFAISDLPAFKILGIEPSNLLRPSKSDVVSFITSNILTPSDISLPNSFAAEIAPYILLRQNSITTDDFKNNYILYNIRFSVGTVNDKKDNNKYKLGLGLRFTLIDNGDLRKDKDYINKIEKISFNMVHLKNIWEDEYKTINTNHDDPGFVEKRDLYVKLKIKEYENANNNEIKQEEENYKKLYWNKEKFDIAFGVLGSSPDSLAKNIKLKLLSAWSTYAFPLSSFGQLLIGGNINYNSLSDKGTGSISSRLYLGSNNIKGFLEAQYKKDNDVKSTNWFLGLGTELNILKDVWINYYAGYESNKINTDNTSKFVSQFDIKLALQ